jgi:hypothetical protein
MIGLLRTWLSRLIGTRRAWAYALGRVVAVVRSGRSTMGSCGTPVELSVALLRVGDLPAICRNKCGLPSRDR